MHLDFVKNIIQDLTCTEILIFYSWSSVNILIVRWMDVGKKNHARGYCNLHYRRFNTHGDPNTVLVTQRTTCKAEGCSTKHSSHGYCQKHYRRWERHGDHNVVLNRNGKKINIQMHTEL